MKLYAEIASLNAVELDETQAVTKKVLNWYDYKGTYVIQQELLLNGPLLEILGENCDFFNNGVDFASMKQGCQEYFEKLGMPLGFDLYVSGLLNLANVAGNDWGTDPNSDIGTGKEN